MQFNLRPFSYGNDKIHHLAQALSLLYIKMIYFHEIYVKTALTNQPSSKFWSLHVEEAGRRIFCERFHFFGNGTIHFSMEFPLQSPQDLFSNDTHLFFICSLHKTQLTWNYSSRNGCTFCLECRLFMILWMFNERWLLVRNTTTPAVAVNPFKLSIYRLVHCFQVNFGWPWYRSIYINKWWFEFPLKTKICIRQINANQQDVHVLRSQYNVHCTMYIFFSVEFWLKHWFHVDIWAFIVSLAQTTKWCWICVTTFRIESVDSVKRYFTSNYIDHCCASKLPRVTLSDGALLNP